MALQYLHGLETIELDSPSGPVETVKSNVIGLVGTAPNADPNMFPLNTPVALFANSVDASSLGTDGTLLDAVDAIYSQRASVIVVTRVSEGNTEADTWANAVGSPTGKTGIWSLLKARPTLRVTPKILIAPGLTSGRPQYGVVSIAVSAEGSGYVADTTSVTITAPPPGGIQATARAQVVGGKVTGIIMTHGGSGYEEEPTVTIVGAGTGATATSALGAVANPVAQTLGAIVDRLRAVAFVDGPGTNYAAAVQYRNDFGSQRMMVLDPGVLHFDIESSSYVNRPAAAYAAGIQSRVDLEKGFWYSFSNELIQNIGGPGRPVDWMPNDSETEANQLNANQVTTIIHEDGFRFWGLRGTGTDSLWAQLSVRRIADMVYESLEFAERKRLDKPFSVRLLRAIEDDVNFYLDQLADRGALVPGGSCRISPKKNTANELAAGRLRVNFDYEPVACLERLTFEAERNPTLYTDFIETFSRSSL